MSPKFVTLPLEVRNEIYSHVFDYGHFMPSSERCCKRQLVRFSHHSDNVFQRFNADTFLALLEVSHQISNEAATCFYGNVIFWGECHQIAAFVKGIGARRRDLIRRVEIKHLASTDSQFGVDDTLELLAALPKLRTARITAWNRDFARLQKQLIQSGTWEIDDTLVSFVEKLRQRRRDICFWPWAINIILWTGGNFKRTLLPESPGGSED